MSDFNAKMHQIRFRLGLRPRPRWGSLQRSPRPLAGFKGPTSKGRGGEEGRERERGGEGRKEKGREGPHQLGGPRAPKHVKTALTKPSLKLFRPSGSPIVEAFATPCADTTFQGEPLHRGVNYTGVGKLAIFNGYCRVSRKRCEIGRWLLWNVNRKSCVPDLLYNFRWPWVTPNPGFKVTVYLEVEYLQNGAF